MRFAVNVPNFGVFADPRVVADLARRAEQAGWDALFVWDHVTWVKDRNRAGLGAPVEDEYGSFGDTTDVRKLATRLDEGLFVLNKLWSGEHVTFHGQELVVDDVRFVPVPAQRPRVPICTRTAGTANPGPMRPWCERSVSS